MRHEWTIFKSWMQKFRKKIAVNRLLRFFQNIERDNPLKLSFCTPSMICADSSTLSGTQNKRIWRSPVTPPFSGWHRHCKLQWWEKNWGSHQGTLHMRALTLKEADHNHNLWKMTLIFDENHKFIKHLNNVNKNKHQISLKMSCLNFFFFFLAYFKWSCGVWN